MNATRVAVGGGWGGLFVAYDAAYRFVPAMPRFGDTVNSTDYLVLALPLACTASFMALLVRLHLRHAELQRHACVDLQLVSAGTLASSDTASESSSDDDETGTRSPRPPNDHVP